MSNDIKLGLSRIKEVNSKCIVQYKFHDNNLQCCSYISSVVPKIVTCKHYNNIVADKFDKYFLVFLKETLAQLLIGV